MWEQCTCISWRSEFPGRLWRVACSFATPEAISLHWGAIKYWEGFNCHKFQCGGSLYLAWKYIELKKLRSPNINRKSTCWWCFVSTNTYLDKKFEAFDLFVHWYDYKHEVSGQSCGNPKSILASVSLVCRKNEVSILLQFRIWCSNQWRGVCNLQKQSEFKYLLSRGFFKSIIASYRYIHNWWHTKSSWKIAVAWFCSEPWLQFPVHHQYLISLLPLALICAHRYCKFKAMNYAATIEQPA